MYSCLLEIAAELLLTLCRHHGRGICGVRTSGRFFAQREGVCDTSVETYRCKTARHCSQLPGKFHFPRMSCYKCGFLVLHQRKKTLLFFYCRRPNSWFMETSVPKIFWSQGEVWSWAQRLSSNSVTRGSRRAFCHGKVGANEKWKWCIVSVARRSPWVQRVCACCVHRAWQPLPCEIQNHRSSSFFFHGGLILFKKIPPQIPMYLRYLKLFTSWSNFALTLQRCLFFISGKTLQSASSGFRGSPRSASTTVCLTATRPTSGALGSRCWKSATTVTFLSAAVLCLRYCGFERSLKRDLTRTTCL